MLKRINQHKNKGADFERASYVEAEILNRAVKKNLNVFSKSKELAFLFPHKELFIRTNPYALFFFKDDAVISNMFQQIIPVVTLTILKTISYVFIIVCSWSLMLICGGPSRSTSLAMRNMIRPRQQLAELRRRAAAPRPNQWIRKSGWRKRLAIRSA